LRGTAKEPSSNAHSDVEYMSSSNADELINRQIQNHLAGVVARSSGRFMPTKMVISWCAKEAVVRRCCPDRAWYPLVVPDHPDVFSKQQVASVHDRVCPKSSQFKMTHYYLQTGHPHPDKLNRDIYASDCNGRAFPVFDKLYRWNNMLLSMSELLVQAGEVAAQELVNLAYKHDPAFVVYRISSHYLEALRYVGS
jgi:hypothetical protein